MRVFLKRMLKRFKDRKAERSIPTPLEELLATSTRKLEAATLLSEMDRDYERRFKDTAVQMFAPDSKHKGIDLKHPVDKMPFISAYLMTRAAERQAKILEVQNELVEIQNQLVSKSLKSSSKFGKFSILVSIIAIVVAALGYWNSNKAIRSSSAWQKEQMIVLRTVRDDIKTTTQPAKPAKYPAEHTALLKAIADNTTQMQFLIQQLRKDEQPAATEPSTGGRDPMINIGIDEQPATTEPEPMIDIGVEDKAAKTSSEPMVDIGVDDDNE
jgi:hypothetical protein